MFLHIPKTGGTWVKHVLKERKLIRAQLGHQHSDWDRAYWHDKLHHDLKVARYLARRAIRSPRAQARMEPGSFRFCFVREPLRWYESYWRFMQSLDWGWKNWGDEKDPYKWHPCAMINQLGDSDFNSFVAKVNQKRPGYVTELYSWYVRPGIGFVGQQEHMHRDLARAFALMGIEIRDEEISAAPRQTRPPPSFPSRSGTPKVKKATLRLEYAGYIRFGYDPEGSRRSGTKRRHEKAEMADRS